MENVKLDKLEKSVNFSPRDFLDLELRRNEGKQECWKFLKMGFSFFPLVGLTLFDCNGLLGSSQTYISSWLTSLKLTITSPPTHRALTHLHTPELKNTHTQPHSNFHIKDLSVTFQELFSNLLDSPPISKTKTKPYLASAITFPLV